MDVSGVQQLIASVGFPIVMCGALFWYINNLQKQHTEEMSKMSEAINNNTVVMQKLIDKLDN